MEIQTTLKLQLRVAQESYKAFLDKFWKDSLAFQIRDKIWLLRKKIKTTWPCNKLDYKRLGPFCIQEQINLMAYWLKLPTSKKVHPVFHVFLLDAYGKSTLSGRIQPLSLCVEIENHMKYVVEKVLALWRRWEKLEYLIQWHGCDINEPQKVQKFHRQYFDKSKVGH